MRRRPSRVRSDFPIGTVFAAAQAAVQHISSTLRSRPMPRSDAAHERLLVPCERPSAGFRGGCVFDAAAWRNLDQAVDLGLLKQLTQGVDDLPDGPFVQAVCRPRGGRR